MTVQCSPYPAYKPSGIPWLGDIPAHWIFDRAKFIFRKMSRPTREEDDVVTAFRDGTVTLRSNRRTEGFTFSIKEIGYQGVRKGDLVIHQMDGFAGAIGVSDSDGKCTPIYSICTPIIPAITHYYGYLLRHMAKSDFILSLAKGIRERSSDFRFDVFRELVLPIPPLPEQQAIAAYLDGETARLDAVIAAYRRLLALLDEKRRALITHAVTRGLDPAVPLKDSGIEWLGQIPAHWKVKPLFSVLYERQVSNKTGIETNVLSLSYGKIVKRDVESNLGLLPESFNTYQIVDPGNIILRLTDLQNDKRSLRTGLVRERGIITSAYICLAVKKDDCPEFLEKLLHSYDITKVFYTFGAGVRQTMKFEDLKRIPVLLPPFAEQQAIAAYLDRETARLDGLKARMETLLARLQEYRAALISAAVTGKMDVSQFQKEQT